MDETVEVYDTIDDTVIINAMGGDLTQEGIVNTSFIPSEIVSQRDRKIEVERVTETMLSYTGNGYICQEDMNPNLGTIDS